jgi:hypothetical protein
MRVGIKQVDFGGWAAAAEEQDVAKAVYLSDNMMIMVMQLDD